jgi:hypothetical protein
MSINASLERAKQKQAAELRSLRRQLREGALPPIPTMDGLGLSLDVPPEDEEDEPWEDVLEADPKFREVVRSVEVLLRTAKTALEGSVETAISKGSKVLHVELDDQWGGREGHVGSVPELASLDLPESGLSTTR